MCLICKFQSVIGESVHYFLVQRRRARIYKSMPAERYQVYEPDRIRRLIETGNYHGKKQI